MQPKYKFAEGEKVLCFHGPLIYEAKALKSTVTKDKQLKYFVHYAGWNKNWDEWVPEHRVLKYNESNLQWQKELQKEHDAKKEKNKKGTPKGKKGEAMANTAKDSGAVSSGGSESRASTPSKELNTSTSTTTASGATSATGGRGNRSKQNATPIAADLKKDTTTKEETAKDEKEEPAAKKKRGTSTSTNPDKSIAVASDPKSTTTISSNTSTIVSSTAPATIVTTTSSTITAAAPIPALTTTSSTGNRLDSCVESEETFLSKIEVKIKIPDELKQCLADDWDAITRQHKLLEIPAKITVQDIVDQYINLKKSAKSINACKELAISDVLNGVIEYFNVMLGSQLLYKFERPQYAEILQQYPDTPLSKLYGSFHLLRLFVKLGSMLGYSALDEKSMQMLLVHLHDFLKFMVKNSATFFSMSSFVNATPEYHRHTQ